MDGNLFGHLLATPIGPAAGLHTQLTQNILCAWLCGGRLIGLKTVQIDGMHSLQGGAEMALILRRVATSALFCSPIGRTDAADPGSRRNGRGRRGWLLNVDGANRRRGEKA